MNNILEEINRIRVDRPYVIDYTNNNRYRIVAIEKDGSKTAYCFGVPIYNDKTKKLLGLNFDINGILPQFVGSNAKVSFGKNTVKLEGPNSMFEVVFREGITAKSKKEMRYGSFVINPTTNGCFITADCTKERPVTFNLISKKPYLNVKCNEQYFALMESKFKPYITVSCVGALGRGDPIIAPAKVKYDKLNNNEFLISVYLESPAASRVRFEINMYEQKLFQDTTVDSKHTKTNNAYGGMAFLGKSNTYGEQWLYTRLDTPMIYDLLNHRINSMCVYIPQHNMSYTNIRAYSVTERFCSFGSNWSNKKSAGKVVADSTSVFGYQKLDITDMFIDQYSRQARKTDGMILRTKKKDAGFVVLSTGDCYYAPQILSVNYK